MTNDEINRAVAVALGWIPMEGGMGIGWFQIGTTVKAPPHWQFCSDPAAADLVRIEIERRGWDWEIATFLSAVNPDDPKLYGASVRWHKRRTRGTSNVSPHIALCLAFLAAVEAEKEVSK